MSAGTKACRFCGREGRFYRDEPMGYVEWHEWAEKKAKTHRQERCPTCGLWAIWKPLNQARRREASARRGVSENT